MSPGSVPTPLSSTPWSVQTSFKTLRASSSCWQAMSGKELCGLVCSRWSQWWRQDGNTLIFKQSLCTGTLLNQDPSLFQDSTTLSKNERDKLFSPGPKKANIHYADKKRSKDDLLPAGVENWVILVSAFWWYNTLTDGSWYMPAITTPSFYFIFVLLW